MGDVCSVYIFGNTTYNTQHVGLGLIYLYPYQYKTIEMDANYAERISLFMLSACKTALWASTQNDIFQSSIQLQSIEHADKDFVEDTVANVIKNVFEDAVEEAVEDAVLNTVEDAVEDWGGLGFKIGATKKTWSLFYFEETARYSPNSNTI